MHCLKCCEYWVQRLNFFYRPLKLSVKIKMLCLRLFLPPNSFFKKDDKYYYNENAFFGRWIINTKPEDTFYAKTMSL